MNLSHSSTLHPPRLCKDFGTMSHGFVCRGDLDAKTRAEVARAMECRADAARGGWWVVDGSWMGRGWVDLGLGNG